MNAEQEALVHLAILGKRERSYCFAKNYALPQNDPKAKREAWLKPDEIYEWAMQGNREGFTCWVSLNDKDFDKIEGVKALCDFWLDIDARKHGTNDRTATQEELDQAQLRARKLREHIEVTYNTIGFLAYSGNGFHIHFPLPRHEMEGEELRRQVNDKVREFAKQVSATVHEEIDSTYDIRRVTTLIGTENLKISSKPLRTSWTSEVLEKGLQAALSDVDTARTKNQSLLESILAIDTKAATSENKATDENSIVVPDIAAILEKNPTLKDTYMGNWEKYNFKSRSEAENYTVLEFMRYGLKPARIREVMRNSKVGKWNDPKTSQAYRDITLTKAANFVKKRGFKTAHSKRKRGRAKPDAREEARTSSITRKNRFRRGY